MLFSQKISFPPARNIALTKAFLIVFYAVGLMGILLPISFSLFIRLIPVALLISAAALAFFHGRFSSKHLIIYGGVFLLGFIIEAVGVNTGIVFGPYHYGESLGIKIFSTPLIIGLNWLLLVYLTSSLLNPLEIPAAIKVIAGAALMLAYDLLLEQVAPGLDMWYWHTNTVPVQNYVSWFIIASLFHALFQQYNAARLNKLAPFLFVCQVLFFLSLFIFLS